MLNRKQLLPIAGALALAGCRIEVAVPVGGAVATESGNYSCAVSQNCTVQVEDTAFNEIFVAEPQDGYLFSGWKKVERGLCGGSLEPCALETSWMAGEPEWLAILDSDEAFKLVPQFQPSDQIRHYEVGDVVRLSGTLTQLQGLGIATETSVTARMDFLPPIYHLDAESVIAARLVVSDQVGEELESQTIHFWQEETSGALFQLTDEYGNYLLNTVVNENGLVAVPSPLEPFAEIIEEFAALYGGHTYQQLTTGTRTVEIGEVEVLETSAGELDAYPVKVDDSYTYLVSFDDYKRDQSVENKLTLWISKVKGIVKLKGVQQIYTANGQLEKVKTLELQMTGSSY